MKYDTVWDEELLLDAAKALKNSCAEYYTCHCTGMEQFYFLKDNVGPKMNYISTGMTIEV